MSQRSDDSTTQTPISVLVTGAYGRMGREVVKAVLGNPETRLVAAVDRTGAGADAGETAGATRCGVAITDDLAAAFLNAQPQVMVDFTVAEAARENIRAAIEAGVRPVVGTTGLALDEIAEIRRLADEKGLGAVIAPNFAIGAVLMMLFSAQAARYLPDVEIIEYHHEKKIDAPSGTAMKTAEMIAAARSGEPAPRPANETEILQGARGGAHPGGIPVHSVRLPGHVAHQTVLFGGPGQTLTIRHDSLDRTSFMPGVLLAVKRVVGVTGLVYGLEGLLD
jgi:4-hydroxy-tetrahydrodipicolinate reductase